MAALGYELGEELGGLSEGLGLEGGLVKLRDGVNVGLNDTGNDESSLASCLSASCSLARVSCRSTLSNAPRKSVAVEAKSLLILAKAT